MSEKSFIISQLIQKYLKNELTEAEKKELDQWVASSENNKIAFKELTDEKWVAGELEKFYNYESLTLNSSQKGKSDFEDPKIRRMFSWTRIAAVAVIILMLGAGVYWFTIKGHNNNLASTEKPAIKNDVAPGREGAILTLDGGKQIVLDSAQNGSLAQQGNSVVVKENGQLSIRKNSEGDAEEVVYNTMTTPRGRQYKLVLADGSAVWLNAASSIHFPTSFPGNERRVDITGEAYFEVAHNARQPFIVSVNGMDVKVLGTHFNVNAYSDEATIKTTLLEGSVKVSMSSPSPSERDGVRLKPGEQAQIENHGNPLIPKIMVQTVNVDEAVAWKNGLFSLNKTDMQTFMRMISRWYDVDVIYEGGIPKGTISGEAQRSLSFAQMQKVLQLTDVHFRIEGKKLIVTH